MLDAKNINDYHKNRLLPVVTVEFGQGAGVEQGQTGGRGVLRTELHTREFAYCISLMGRTPTAPPSAVLKYRSRIQIPVFESPFRTHRVQSDHRKCNDVSETIG